MNQNKYSVKICAICGKKMIYEKIEAGVFLRPFYFYRPKINPAFFNSRIY